MADSQNTIALRAEIAQVEKKLKALQAAGKGLGSVKNEIKETYEGGDAEDLYGNKYDEMSNEEESTIQKYKKKFEEEKNNMVKEINAQKFSLNLTISGLNAEIFITNLIG
mgnify:CR=1 FL=1